MHGVHAYRRPAAGQDRGERDLHSFCPRIRDGAAVPTVAVFGVVNRQGLGVHPAGGHQDHPRIVGVAQDRQQQLRQQHRPQDVGGQRDLMPDPVPVKGLRAGGRQHSGVVDEHVQRRNPARQIGRERADAVQVGHIAHLHRHVAGDLLAGPLPALAVADGQQHGRSESGQARRDRLADTAVRAGDQGGPALQRVRWRVVRPPQLPQPIPDAGVAGDDRAIQGCVE